MAAAVLALPLVLIAPNAVMLVAKIALGAVVYSALAFLFWIVSGKPDGLERTALVKAAETGARVKGRLRRA